MMITIPKNTIVKIDLTPDELGRSFAFSDSDDQADFLTASAIGCKKYDWSFQSRAVVDSIGNKQLVIDFLETLLCHLKEKDDVYCI